jgi:hypothetical protein
MGQAPPLGIKQAGGLSGNGNPDRMIRNRASRGITGTFNLGQSGGVSPVGKDLQDGVIIHQS